MIRLLPILIMLIIYPFIVKMNVFPTPRGSFEYLVHPLGDANGDFYFYEKLKLLIPISAVLLLVFLLKKEKLKTRYNIGIGIYIIGITISTLLSPFLSIAVKGGGNRYEGYYALLSYGVLCLCLLNISVKDIKKVKVIIYSLFAGGIVVAITGLTEFFGRSIYKIPFLADFILPNEELLRGVGSPSGGYISLIQVIKESPKFHNVSSSLGNSNYGGSFAALILGVAVVLFIERKRIVDKILPGTVYTLVFALLLASRSRAGMVSFQACLILLFILKFKNLKRYLGSVITLCLISAAVFTSMNYFAGGRIGDKMSDFEVAKKSELRELIATDNKLILDTYKGKLYTSINNGNLEFTDTENRRVPVKKVGERLFLEDERYENISFSKDERYNNLFYLEYMETRKYPVVIAGNSFKTIGREGLMEDIVSPPRIREVDSIQTKGSARLYIWSRSLPLIKKTGLFGYGPDTYPIIYPQNDYFGKFIAYGTPYMFISKPHNMYLQMAMNTGLISLVGFLMVVIPYLIQSLNIHRRGDTGDERTIIALGVFIGTFSYLFAGLFNDSAVSIAPNFWMMLGLGIALNTYIIKDNKEKNIEAMKNRV